MTDTNKCRLCGGEFFLEPLLHYPNSPSSAQGFLDSLEVINDVVDLKIYQCKCCGLVQHSLPPVSYYKEVIRAIAFSSEMAIFRTKQLGKWLQENNLNNKLILEIGAGKGEYQELLRNSGAVNLYGIEANQKSIECAVKCGFNVVEGYLNPKFTNPWRNKFDAFAVFSFMEHWPDINGSLRALTELLQDDAIGIVEVPNFNLIVDNGMYSEFTTDHIFYFDQQTLKNALEWNGFEVVKIESVWHNYILSAQVKKRKPFTTDVFLSKQTKIIEEINNYVVKFDSGKVVVWGAGHQSLAILNMSNLKDKISHVIDSAEFKQGKYTPGSHLYIKNPDSLKLDKLSAVIIMAAAYSDEVKDVILNNYPNIKNIAILREDCLKEIIFEI